VPRFGSGPAATEDQVALIADRLNELTRQLERVRTEAADRDLAVEHLREAWRTVEGRTRRHEVGQDAIREMRTALTDVSERFEQEAALRRDSTGALGKNLDRDRLSIEDTATLLGDLAFRVRALEERDAAEHVERERLVVGLGDGRERSDALDARLADLEGVARADREAVRLLADGASGLAVQLPPLHEHLERLDVQLREFKREQRAASDALATLRVQRDREAELLDLLEQQRALRIRTEERIAAFDDTLGRIEGWLREQAEEQRALASRLDALEARSAALLDRVESQRLAVVEHFRLAAAVDEEAARREIDEAERRRRASRAVLVRLTEQSDALAHESPL
jgi:chromosome segregation ATPase